MRQKLIVLREQLKSRVLAQPTDAAAFSQLASVHAQLGEADACGRLARQVCAQKPDSWRQAARALHDGLGSHAAEELLMDLLSLPSTEDATRAQVPGTWLREPPVRGLRAPRPAAAFGSNPVVSEGR